MAYILKKISQISDLTFYFRETRKRRGKQTPQKQNKNNQEHEEIENKNGRQNL